MTYKTIFSIYTGYRTSNIAHEFNIKAVEQTFQIG